MRENGKHDRCFELKKMVSNSAVIRFEIEKFVGRSTVPASMFGIHELQVGTVADTTPQLVFVTVLDAELH